MVQASASSVNIITATRPFSRPMNTPSTSTTLGSLAVVTAEPATVDGTSIVFTPDDNLVLAVPVIVGGNNKDGQVQFAGIRKANAPVKRTITAITQANPAVVTVDEDHGYSTGDEVNIEDVVGMTELNGKRFTATNVTATTFSINVDSSGYTAYSSGGLATADKDLNRECWMKFFLGLFDVTAGNLAGAANTPFLADEYVCDTIAADGGYNTSGVPQIYSPADGTTGADTPGYLMIDALGFSQIEATFKRDGGPVGGASAATSMNVLFVSL